MLVPGVRLRKSGNWQLWLGCDTLVPGNELPYCQVPIRRVSWIAYASQQESDVVGGRCVLSEYPVEDWVSRRVRRADRGFDFRPRVRPEPNKTATCGMSRGDRSIDCVQADDSVLMCDGSWSR